MSGHSQTPNGPGGGDQDDIDEVRDGGGPTWSLEEVARLWQVRPRRVRKLVASGELIATVVDGVTVVGGSVLEDFLGAHAGVQKGGHFLPLTDPLVGGPFTVDADRRNGPGAA